ncbi:MAG: DUF4838 domain-containing protein [Cyclobacteriaceae bacterium]|nr:DUF4838 domain-containing protein [Cyclobacteriaceae bacterium]
MKAVTRNFLAITSFFILLLTGCNQTHYLVFDGKSEYCIYVHPGASETELFAARLLQDHFTKISGCEIPVNHEFIPNQPTIYIGFQNLPEKLLKSIPDTSLPEEHYIIKSDGRDLVLAGGGRRGNLYAVIGFLSDHLGCRWYTRTVHKLPFKNKIPLSKTDELHKPVFEYREAWFHEAYDSEWAVLNRLNPSIRPIPDSMGGSYITYPFAHTFDRLVPVDEYADTHPEYFSEINGERQKTLSQLCLTNPDVLKIATARVFQWIEEHPYADIISVDQNDGEGYCECVHCKAIDEAEGSQAGSLLFFVNQIADTVARVYPSKKIQTFAYHYTEEPPKTMRPRDNVTIRLCHYDYCSAHHLEDCEDHKPFTERFEKWSRIAKRISVWDYYTDFSHYFIPFPNFETFKHDVQWYADRNVKGMFMQGNNVPDNGGGEFSELRAWVFAQLMWNPYQDAQALIDEFVDNLFEDAAPFVHDYIKLLHDFVKNDHGHHFNIWSQPAQMRYLNPDIINAAEALFRQAMEVASGKPDLLERVELAYLPVLYTRLYFYSIGSRLYLDDDKMPETLNHFKKIVARHKIRTYAETHGDIEKFIERVAFSGKYHTEWWLAGPFDNANLKGLSTVFGPEKQFNLSEGFIGKESVKVNWQSYDDPTSGYIDFTGIFDPNIYTVAYACKIIQSSEEKKVKFGIGSNDGVRVWVNDKLVLDRPVSRKAEPNQDIIEVKLKKGDNKILLKVDQLELGWGFYFTELTE